MSALARLQDTLAICDLLYCYARGVDRRDLDLVRSCFAPDCSYEGSLASGTIGDMLAALPVAWTRYDTTLHFMSEPQVVIEGESARSETPTVAYHVLPEPGAGLRIVGVRYLDDWTRRDGRWRIAHRRVQREFET